MNLFKSVRKQNSTSNPFWLCMHWFQVLVGTIEFRWNYCSHYFAQEDMKIFLPSHCFSWTVFDSENGLNPFLSNCDDPKFTTFDQLVHIRLAHILILCGGSGWGLMESWELVKIQTVSWEITSLFYSELRSADRSKNRLKLPFQLLSNLYITNIH